jgi:hypothetical protein
MSALSDSVVFSLKYAVLSTVFMRIMHFGRLVYHVQQISLQKKSLRIRYQSLAVVKMNRTVKKEHYNMTSQSTEHGARTKFRNIL